MSRLKVSVVLICALEGHPVFGDRATQLSIQHPDPGLTIFNCPIFISNVFSAAIQKEKHGI